jgi:hypothetical protein
MWLPELPQQNIVGLGCKAHIVNNCANAAFDSIFVDIEVLVTKISGYFSMCMVHLVT